MESQLDEILKDFQVESKKLIKEMKTVLDKCEGDMTLARSLEDYGMYVDRIMGGAKNIAINVSDPGHIIHKIADYSGVCKAVGYKSSQVTDNEPLFDTCVALLMDATDVLEVMFRNLIQKPAVPIDQLINQHLIDRLKWVSQKFGENYRSSVAIGQQKMSQGEIDGLLRKLGVG